MSASSHRYAVEFYSQEGSTLGQVPVTVDFEPAMECARFEAIRRSRRPIEENDTGGEATSILPLWHPRVGAPYIGGFRVLLPAGGAGGAGGAREFSTDYFKGLVRQASGALVETGKLRAGDRFLYLIVAFPDARAADPEPGSPIDRPFRTTTVVPTLTLKETRLGELLSGAAEVGRARDGDLPVLIPQRVLEEAAVASREAGAMEVAGLLIGHLHRDPGVPELFVEVTAQLPARNTEADSSKLTFTPDTWTAAQAALDLRRRDEIYVGWWHSHIVRELCKSCPIERRRACPLASDFFSEHDRGLHRAVFPRAYSVALVVNDVDDDDDITYSLFGWRRGLVEPRGFHVTGASPPAAPAREPTAHVRRARSRR